MGVKKDFGGEGGGEDAGPIFSPVPEIWYDAFAAQFLGRHGRYREQ